nr:hypothetical protein [Tanacetum cinerariifolium]
MLHVLRVEIVINSPWMLSKNWLVQKQTAFGKDISNPFMADNLPKIVWFSTHHVTFNEHLASPKVNSSCDSPLLRINTPKSDEDRLKLMELMVFLLQKGVYGEIRITAAHLLSYSYQANNSDAAEGFEQIINFLSGSYIHYALTVSPHIYILCIKQFWNSVSVKRSGDVTKLQALVDKKKIVISKAVIREILQLNNAEGVICLPNEEIFAGQRFNFSKYIFDSLVRNVDSSSKFYMVGKGFSGVETPLFEGMIADRQPAEEELGAEQVQVDAVVAAAVIEDVAEDVAHGEAFTATFQQVLDTCFALLRCVEHLEHDNVAQRLKIVKLKARVKKLEKTDKIKSLKFRRLRKVGTSRQVGSSDDMEDVFNQGRMINEDERIELVKDAAQSEGRQADKQAKIYNIDMDHSSKVLSMQEDDLEVQKVVEVVTIAKIITEESSLKNSAKTPAETPKVKDKGKGIMVEAPKPMKKKDQIKMDAKYARKLQEEIDRDHDGFNKDVDWDAAMDHRGNGRRRSGDYQSINETPAQKAAKRRKLTTPLVSKVLVVDYQIVLIDNKLRFKVIRADETHQLYISFATLLKNFDREDLETLWRIVKDRFSTSKPTNFSDEHLLLTLKKMFEEPDGQDAIWRNQKSVHGLSLVKR